jgi:glycosyltransferase involved in cell wall biosynthesis
MDRKLRILTNNIHTSYACELARLGHDFFVEKDVWDTHLRPKPENWKPVDLSTEKNFDLILVNHNWDLPKKYMALNAPMIFSVLADCSEGTFPEWIEDRVEAVTFLGKEVYDRWKFENPLKKRILELGLESSPFRSKDRSPATILTVGCNIGRRWDKGHCQYVTVAGFLPLTLVGPDNEGLPGAVGNVTYNELLDFYASYQIYFNPGPIVGISMIEAMMSGMPVVTFRTINLTDMIQNGVNGFVVDTVDGAVMRLRQLREDPELRKIMGAASRATALQRFSFQRWARGWELLFSTALDE